MGDSTISTVIEGTVGDPAQVNQYKEALSLDQVPRNAQGEAEDIAGSLGTETEQFKDIHMNGNIFNGGTQGGFTPSGVMLPYTASVSVAPTGWIFANGDTIGAGGSGATHTGEEFRYLFNFYKDISSYGNAGTEDFDLGDTVLIPDPNGRFVRSIGSQNPDGSGMGVTQLDAVSQHSHGILINGAGANVSRIFVNEFVGNTATSNTEVAGGNEGRPKAISFPYIIKV